MRRSSSRLDLKRWNIPGMSLRLARSPVAPKRMTVVAAVIPPESPTTADSTSADVFSRRDRHHRPARGSGVQACEELPGPLLLRRPEHLGGAALLVDHAVV